MCVCVYLYVELEGAAYVHREGGRALKHVCDPTAAPHKGCGNDVYDKTLLFAIPPVGSCRRTDAVAEFGIISCHHAYLKKKKKEKRDGNYHVPSRIPNTHSEKLVS
jgi:hypothetical protein